MVCLNEAIIIIYLEIYLSTTEKRQFCVDCFGALLLLNYSSIELPRFEVLR